MPGEERRKRLIFSTSFGFPRAMYLKKPRSFLIWLNGEVEPSVVFRLSDPLGEWQYSSRS
ncbi:MAG: hypothetical protein P4M11_15905 [Candidatus Pacebacteria bacterium]|nr:hypothetical protein [Candidatus Paceibacterota bacterium]